MPAILTDKDVSILKDVVKFFRDFVRPNKSGQPPQLPPSSFTLVYFVLTEDMNETTQGEASCTVFRYWKPSIEAYEEGSKEGVVVDNSDPQIFGGALDGASGKGFLRSGNGRMVIEPITMYC